jgi:valyl-tRNA synthetase
MGILEEMEEIKKCVKYVRKLRNEKHISKSIPLYFVMDEGTISSIANLKVLNEIFTKLSNFKIVSDKDN